MARMLLRLAVLVALVAIPSVMRAADTSEMLDCYNGDTGPWADIDDDETTYVGVGSSPTVFNNGWRFEAGVDEEIQCAWIVPDDFDEGNVLRIGGWLKDDDFCGSSCSGDGTMAWEFGWRTFSSGNRMWGSWNTVPVVANIARASCTALINPKGYCADTYRVVTPTLTATGSPGDLIIFRIKRVGTSNDDTVTTDFHLARVRFDYTNP